MIDTLILRPVTIKDAEMLLEWRNEPGTRNASHSASEITRGEHVAWLKKALSNSQRRLFIAEENQTPVGTVRADLSEGVWELSWTTAPSARGRGVATRMVSLLTQDISEEIRAEVKVGNIASARAAENAGLTFRHETNGVLHYSRDAVS